MSNTTRWAVWHQHGSTLAAVLAALAITVIGCGHVYHPKSSRHTGVHKMGPPPHAPAHGYRHKHQDNVELVFNAGIGVYVVVGHPDHYHDGKRYYRRARGEWQVSHQLDGVWLSVSFREVPSGLRTKKAKKKPKPGHGPPAKHSY